MQKRKFDELISHFNRKVSDMSIDQKYKMELLGMISAIGFAHEKELSTNLASLGTDCISRQAAIDAIEKKSDEIYKTKQDGATFPHDDLFQGMAYAEDVVKRLPSAQPEPCEDAVSRLEIIRNLHKYFKEGFEQDKWWNSGHVIHAIMDAPFVTPKQRTGKWIDVDVMGMPAQACDQCKTFFPLAYTGGGHHYCPNCGAKMEGEQDG